MKKILLVLGLLSLDLYPRRGAGSSARSSTLGVECIRLSGYGCDGFLVQKLVCLGHGHG